MFPIWEVDKDGNVIDNDLWTQEQIDQAKAGGRNIITFSYGEGFYTPKFDLVNNQWVEGALDIALKYAQDTKKDELNAQCEATIEAGFTSSNGHFYRTNRDDQTNMIGQKDELNFDATINTVSWETEDEGYVDHTRDEWLQVYREAFAFKRQQILKYAQLKAQIYAATTPEQVQATVWD